MATPLQGSQDTFTSPIALSPASQYPFPVTGTPQTQHASSRASVVRGLTASTVTSAGGTSDISINRTGIAETSQNAISTLLQHPIVRTGVPSHATISASGYKAPTQRDIPPVTLTNIPHVDAKTFHPYLAQVGSIYEAFQRAKNEDEGGEKSLFHRDRKDSRVEEWEAVLSKRLQRPSHSRANSTASSLSSPLEAPQAKSRRNTQRRQAVTPLSTIPSVYADDDFHLENPRTFDIVSEHSEIVKDPKAAPSGRKSLATNAILQEKLSWYMDTVEVHLISSISTASKSFFSALGSLRELHSEAADSVDQIQRLRKDLAKLDKDTALHGLKIVNLKQRRDNIRQLAQAIMQLEDIVTAVQHCEDHVENGAIDGAMDDLDDVERLISGKANLHSENNSSGKYDRRDLRGIKALESALDDLSRLRFRVGRGFETRFHSSLLGDIRRHVQSTATSTTLQRWGNAFNRTKLGQRKSASTFPTYMNIGADLRLELEAEMKGLSRARHTTAAASAFRALVLREMKNMIRKQLPSASDDDNISTISASTMGGRQMSAQEKSSVLSRNIRALDGEDWFKTLATIYTNVSESLRRLSVQVKILLDITSNLPENNLRSPPRTPDPATIDQALSSRQLQGRPRSTSSVQAEMQQVLDLSSLLGEGVDLVQNQITKVIKVRSQQNAELPLNDFLRYFTLNRLFADECEAISGRSGTGLKTVLDTQIKDFVTKFGEAQRNQLMKIMDADKWDAKDFAEHDNIVLSRVQGGSTHDAASWTQSTTFWESAEGDIKGSNGITTNGTTASGKEKVPQAVIDEQKYILPESAMAILLLIDSFQHLTAGMPSMRQEVANHLLENLRLFNSRTSQLILGAGATRTAGLKNITTKHLALSSQALSFVIALVPYSREFFRRHLSPAGSQQAVSDFDKVKRLFQEHQQAIHEKFADIMYGRASMHIKTMKTIDWEEAAKDKTVKVSPYMEALAKETTTLQKVLAKHFPEPVVASVMVPVFTSYRDQWKRAYNDVTLKSLAAKERLLADAEVFDSRISKLDGAGDLGSYILNVVKAKPITPDPAAIVATTLASPRTSTEKALPEPSGTKPEAEGTKAEEEINPNPSAK